MHGLLASILYLALLGLLAHPVGQALPRRWFHPDRRPWTPWRWEESGALYRALRVRDWKDKVPDMSRRMGDMVKKRAPRTAAEAEAVLRETCVAELVHGAELVLSVPVFLLMRSSWAVLVYVIFNGLGNLPFLIIQRYNRPRLAAIWRKLKKREEAK